MRLPEHELQPVLGALGREGQVVVDHIYDY
jgi:hypothetical protein